MTLFELFGHEKGAYTGAERRRAGVFERAGTGILFLDEIGDMPLALQSRLLRVLQSRSLTRIGGTRSVRVPARVVCATHQDLGTLVRDGRFREDLYYRIRVLDLRVPPLRERPEGVLWLAERFVAEHGQRFPQERRTCTAPTATGCCVTPGRAMGANCTTPWSAPASWARGTRWPSTWSRHWDPRGRTCL